MDIIKSDIVSLHGAAISMIGGRPENQDDMAYLDTPLGFLIVVCDGMGGGPGGKTASYIVKHEIAKTLCECRPQTSREHALKMAAAHAHHALEDKIKENPVLSGMGSTFVAVLLNSQSAVVAHVGDSRCYRFRGKKCLFRTQDHSLVAELVSKKVMTEEDARLSPQANVITRGLGSTNNHVPEIDEVPYKKGDRFVLCTDGVWGAMQHQELLKAFTQSIDQQRLLSDLSLLVDKIGFSKGGGHDNHTIAIFELEKDSQLKDTISWKKWAVILLSAVIIIALVCVFCSKKTKEPSTSQTTISVSSGVLPAPSSYQKDYGRSSKTENTEVKNDVDTDSGEKVEDKQIDEEVRKRLLEQLGIVKDSDSISKRNNQQYEMKNVPNPMETTQKIINRYDSAKVIGKKSLAEAQKSIETKKVEIKNLFIDLEKQTKNSETHQMVEIISAVVDARHSWDIDREPDSKSKLYGPTAKAKGLMDKQIVRLKELKKSLEQEK